MVKFPFFFLVLFFLSTTSLPAMAHAEEEHDNSDQPPAAAQITPQDNKAALALINQAYLKDVKPIFQKKCFDCHSRFTVFPWYHAIPGIKHLMDWDIREGSSHLEMSDDFPFKAHSSPLATLYALKTVAQEKSMPPIQYRIGHWDSKLTDKDQQIIVHWTRKSIKILKQK